MAFVNKWHAVSPGLPFTRCGVHLIHETVYQTRQAAMTDKLNCQNCVRIVGVVGDERDPSD
jgi:hypothetical protein